jgi:hypothetical protein
MNNHLIPANSWVKIIFLFTTVITISVSGIIVNVISLGLLNTAMMNRQLTNHWGKTITKLLPFFLVYHLMGTICAIPFPEQILFSLRIISFLFLSNFVLYAFSLHTILADFNRIKEWRGFQDIIMFGLTTNEFIRIFMERNKDLSKTKSNGRLSNGLGALFFSFERTWDERDQVQSTAKERYILSKSCMERPFSYFNLVFFLLILIDVSIIFRFPVNYDQILSSICI